MVLDQRKGLRMQVSMPSARTSIFKMRAVEVVLVPFDDGAVLHRRVLDRHQLGQRPAGDHKTADMLREVTRKADQLCREVECRRKVRSVG